MPFHAMCTAIASKFPSLRPEIGKRAITLATSSQTRGRKKYPVKKQD